MRATLFFTTSIEDLHVVPAPQHVTLFLTRHQRSVCMLWIEHRLHLHHSQTPAKTRSLWKPGLYSHRDLSTLAFDDSRLSQISGSQLCWTTQKSSGEQLKFLSGNSGPLPGVQVSGAEPQKYRQTPIRHCPPELLGKPSKETDLLPCWTARPPSPITCSCGLCQTRCTSQAWWEPLSGPHLPQRQPCGSSPRVCMFYGILDSWNIRRRETQRQSFVDHHRNREVSFP